MKRENWSRVRRKGTIERWCRLAWEQFSLCLERGHVTGVISMPDMAGPCPRLLTASSLVFSLPLSSSHNHSFPRRRVRSWRSGKCKFGRANGVPVAVAPWVSTDSLLSMDFVRFLSNCRQRFYTDVHLCFLRFVELWLCKSAVCRASWQKTFRDLHFSNAVKEYVSEGFFVFLLEILDI